MFCGWSAEFDHLPIGDETGGLSTWELLWGDHSDRAGSHPPRPRLGGSSGLVAWLGVWARFARWNYDGADLVLLGWWMGDDASVVSLLRDFFGRAACKRLVVFASTVRQRRHQARVKSLSLRDRGSRGILFRFARCVCPAVHFRSDP